MARSGRSVGAVAPREQPPDLVQEAALEHQRRPRLDRRAQRVALRAEADDHHVEALEPRGAARRGGRRSAGPSHAGPRGPGRRARGPGSECARRPPGRRAGAGGGGARRRSGRPGPRGGGAAPRPAPAPRRAPREARAGRARCRRRRWRAGRRAAMSAQGRRAEPGVVGRREGLARVHDVEEVVRHLPALRRRRPWRCRCRGRGRPAGCRRRRSRPECSRARRSARALFPDAVGPTIAMSGGATVATRPRGAARASRMTPPRTCCLVGIIGEAAAQRSRRALMMLASCSAPRVRLTASSSA